MTTTVSALSGKKRELERKIRLREFVFGIQDGLISTVGLLSGISAATESRSLVVLTGLAAVSYAAFGPSLPAPWYPFPGALAWPWYALVGSGTVLAMGLLHARIFPPMVPQARAEAPG